MSENNMMTPTLETQHLILRPLQLSDAPRSQVLFLQWEIVKYMGAVIPWPYPDDGALLFVKYSLAKVEAGERFSWAITLNAACDDLLIGIIDLFPYDGDDHRGFWIGLPYQKQGYMSEAVAAVNDFAFDVLGLPHLLLNNAEPNLASHRLKEKSGAAIIDVLDDVPFVSGKFRNVRWMLTAEQWRANRNAFLHAGRISLRPAIEGP